MTVAWGGSGVGEILTEHDIGKCQGRVRGFDDYLSSYGLRIVFIDSSHLLHVFVYISGVRT